VSILAVFVKCSMLYKRYGPRLIICGVIRGRWRSMAIFVPIAYLKQNLKEVSDAVGFEILTAATMKTTTFWIITPCG
jgi:hypothetical protein